MAEQIHRSSAASNDDGDDDHERMHALALLDGYVLPMTLMAAIELGLIDHLVAAEGRAVAVEELAARMPRPAEAAARVDRMLRFLASHSVLRCAVEVAPDGEERRSYAAAPVCKWLAVNAGKKDSLAPAARMSLSKMFMDCWQYLKDTVLDGESSFQKAHGVPMFEYLRSNESSNKLVNEGIACRSTITNRKFVELFGGFEGVAVLVDVGGGTGATLQMIKAKHKHLRGVNFDLPHVIPQSPPAEGVEHVGGNMFDNVPCGDAILLKWILHNWGDEDCIKILKNCYTALPANGKVIVLEHILPGTPEPTLAAQSGFGLDVIMLNRFGSGKERTEREYTELIKKAGFSGEFKATYIFNTFWALEFMK
ncbi:unnamed protein product [Urochloa decumbens]|uniref:Uncharacterized protein n=1 Tax=Urochloa decumbens TaxID=240449 RepID=A0ABC9FHL1_9POAL